MVVPTAGPGGGGAGGVVSEILEVLIDFSPLSPTVLAHADATPLVSMRRKHFRHDTREHRKHTGDRQGMADRQEKGCSAHMASRLITQYFALT